MKARYHGGMAYPTRDIPHQATRPHLPGAGRAAPHNARGPCIPRETPLLAQGPADTDHQMDHIPPETDVPIPVHPQLPRARTRKEPRICTNECGSDGDHPPGDRGLHHPPKQASQRHAGGHYCRRGACPRVPAHIPVPSTLVRRPENRHSCGRLWDDGPVKQAAGRAAVELRLKPVWTPVAIFGSLGVCIYVPQAAIG